VVSECYPYTALVGASEFGYTQERPLYKRKPRGMRIADFRPIRAQACDDLIARLAGLRRADPPLDLASHPVTRQLLTEKSPSTEREYKHREDLIDAAICAWTAALWHGHGGKRCQVLGPEPSAAGAGSEATIIAPARPDQRRPMSHFQDIDMPPCFVLEFRDGEGDWLDHALLRASDFDRLDDGAYLCTGNGSRVWLRCLEQRGDEIDVIDVIDGGGDRLTYRLSPFPSDRYPATESPQPPRPG
jgi:hypothetical protein